MKENEPQPDMNSNSAGLPTPPPAAFSEPPLPQVITDADLEDAFLEDALLPLCAPPDLEARISASLNEPETKQFRFLRIAAVAAVFIIGLFAGLVVPFGNMPAEREAEAATLQNNIAAFSRGAKFISDEAALLSELDPKLSATLLVSQLNMYALPETGNNILIMLRSRRDRKLMSTDEFSLFESFFSKAVSDIDRMSAFAEDGILTREEINQINALQIQPPKEISAVQFPTVPTVKYVKISDPFIRQYIDAKRFIYYDDYRNAIPILEANRSNSPAQIRPMFTYWLSRSYMATDNPGKASNEINSLPMPFQERFSASIRTFSYVNGNITITLHGIHLKRPKTTHLLSKSNGGSIVVYTYDDNTVLMQDGLYQESFRSFAQFREFHPDLYNELFNLEKTEPPAEPDNPNE